MFCVYVTGGLKSVAKDNTIVSSFYHNAKGQRIIQRNANNTVLFYGYDPHNYRLKQATVYKIKASETGFDLQNILQDHHYTYDTVGNIVTFTDQTGDGDMKTCSYDPLYRLLSATGKEKGLWQDTIPWQEWDTTAPNNVTRGYV